MSFLNDSQSFNLINSKNYCPITTWHHSDANQPREKAHKDSTDYTALEQKARWLETHWPIFIMVNIYAYDVT